MLSTKYTYLLHNYEQNDSTQLVLYELHSRVLLGYQSVLLL